MEFVKIWIDGLGQSLQGVGYGVASFVPALILAVIIFAIGWVVASLIEKVIEKAFKTMKVDNLMKVAGMEDFMKKAGYELNTGLFIGSLIKWFIIVVFLVASFNVLGLSQVNDFLNSVVLSYLPKVIVAVLILMVAVVIADAMKRIVIATSKAANIRVANLLGSMTKWVIWVFAIMAAFIQLEIAAQIINTLFMGIMIAISLALGLSFGLGGKEVAADILSKVKKEIDSKE